ncbi:MAG: TIGR04211 family SH3 domain-containing protein [Desulfobacteraceae bacterium]|nr:TIGR04211 family SH3 domain-containing protein [Desulfobacteraceae bacterium]
MNKNFKYTIIITFLIIIFSGFAYAESAYVTDITKITMRTAPDSENKIIQMLESGSRVNILERSGAWSKVRAKNGKEGWALTRFLVNKKPAVILVDGFTRENKRLASQVETLKIENKSITEINKKFADFEEKYIELEKKSKGFFELEKKYQTILKKFEHQQEIILDFEDSYKNKIMIWFLIGAGVFVFGVLLGMGAKKNRRSYLR